MFNFKLSFRGFIMQITFVENETSSLEELINIWAKIWAHNYGTKVESVLFLEEDVEKALHRAISPNSDLCRKGCHLNVVPAEGDRIKLEEESRRELPPKNIKEISGKEVNELRSAYKYTMSNEFSWQSTHKVLNRYTSRFNFGTRLGIELLGQLGISIDVGFEKCKEKSKEEARKNVSNFIREITCEPGSITHIKLSYVEAEVKYRIQCPVELKGYVLICCNDAVIYTGPALPNTGRKLRSAHKKWGVPIGQVLKDLENLVEINKNDSILNHEERLILARFRSNQSITACDNVSEARFIIETEAQITELLRIETKFTEEPIPGYKLSTSASKDADYTVSSGKDRSGKTIYLKPVITGDHADLFTIESTVDLDKKHQQTSALLSQAGPSGTVYASEVINGNYAQVTTIPAAGIDPTSAALFKAHAQTRTVSHPPQAATSRNVGFWQNGSASAFGSSAISEEDNASQRTNRMSEANTSSIGRANARTEIYHGPFVQGNHTQLSFYHLPRDNSRDIHYNAFMCGVLASAINIFAHYGMIEQALSNYNSLLLHAVSLGISCRPPEEIQLDKLHNYLEGKISEIAVKFPRSRNYIELGHAVNKYMMVKFSSFSDEIKNQTRDELLQCLASDVLGLPLDLRNNILSIIDSNTEESKAQQVMNQVFDILVISMPQNRLGL